MRNFVPQSIDSIWLDPLLLRHFDFLFFYQYSIYHLTLYHLIFKLLECNIIFVSVCCYFSPLLSYPPASFPLSHHLSFLLCFCLHADHFFYFILHRPLNFIPCFNSSILFNFFISLYHDNTYFLPLCMLISFLHHSSLLLLDLLRLLFTFSLFLHLHLHLSLHISSFKSLLSTSLSFSLLISSIPYRLYFIPIRSHPFMTSQVPGAEGHHWRHHWSPSHLQTQEGSNLHL